MELIGLKVKHTVFGAGVITELEGNYITIEFAAKITKFVYPDAFGKFIKSEDPAVQQSIVDSINDAKAAAEQKRQAEEAARKAAEERRRAVTAVAAPKAKKAKTLDEMFAPDYHAEKLARQPILTYQQVEDQFGIRISGFGRGINPTGNTVVFIY